jgi:hypothetical protein
MGVLLGALGLVIGAAACAGKPDARVPVDDGDARQAFADVVAIAERQTPSAMASLCALSLDECAGMSSPIVTDADGPRTAPGPDRPPEVLCSIDAGDGAWMLVVAGDDGLGRPYVSQVVFARDREGRAVPVREPAFWFGVAYAGTKVTGSTSWSTAYAGSSPTAPEHTEKMLDRAGRACTDD